jgi:hypothetical protein
VCPFSLTDLLVVGLALDITGAGLLAVGLLVSPREIAVLSGSYYDFNAADASPSDRSSRSVASLFEDSLRHLNEVLGVVGIDDLEVARSFTEARPCVSKRWGKHISLRRLDPEDL